MSGLCLWLTASTVAQILVKSGNLNLQSCYSYSPGDCFREILSWKTLGIAHGHSCTTTDAFCSCTFKTSFQEINLVFMDCSERSNLNSVLHLKSKGRNSKQHLGDISLLKGEAQTSCLVTSVSGSQTTAFWQLYMDSWWRLSCSTHPTTSVLS